MYINPLIKKNKKRQKKSTKKNSTRRRGFFGKNTSSTNLSIMPSDPAYMRQYYLEHKQEYHERYLQYKKNPKFVERSKKNSRKHYLENAEDKIRRVQEHRANQLKVAEAQGRVDEHKLAIKNYHKQWYQKNKVRLADNKYLLKYADVMAEFVISLDGF